MRFLTSIVFGTVLLAGPVPEEARAVLDAKCGQCHGAATGMSGFKIDSRDNLLKGGTRGAAVKPGDAAGSLLYQAVAHTGKLAMPPGGKLSDPDIANIKTWIEQGAAWPQGTVSNAPKRSEWWAFQKTKPIRDERAGIDFFLNRKIAEAKLQPAQPADRLTLLRRGSYDLLGLPPTADQIAAFLDDKEPGSWERAIDRMLKSKQYGEKWGRFWLDLARYGDTSGFEQDPYILEGWRYRDYVIKSFNDDKPYDKFAKEQIAGDELYPEDAEARTGTGFYRVGANRDMLFKVEDINAVERLTDAVDTTSSVFLGLTVGCARCHDHKFDPIPQKDYYRMQAVFAPAVNDRVFLEYNTARFSDLAANTREFKLRQMGEQIARIEKPYRASLREKKIEALPDTSRAAVRMAEKKRTSEQQGLVAQAEETLKITDDEVLASLSPADAERMGAIERRLVGIFAGYTAPPMAPGIVDVGREAPRTYIAERGNFLSPGEEVKPGFLTALGGGDIPDPPLHATTTFRRKALAEWVAAADNPLFARVMVNRIWQGHFGTGLLKTPSDWGTRAGEPSHPELLDWLAGQFKDRKWSLKAMHKLIMSSEAYRRSADATPSAASEDPANVLLSHMNRRRLQSEEIRDSVLQV
ncbi:MAG: PSD1 and planctomycete cytochrome C domain-containing protein, partial [Acidobacteriota bacterium]|nr:PSD1 and planctomycete cytochrome C domain-containing protein [Acidobacteriota bacterium]